MTPARRPEPRRQPAGANAALFRNAPWFFTVFACAVVVAFWPSYYSRLDAQPTWAAHAHGIVMTMWCGLIVVQGWLMRSGGRRLHATLGKLSYVLVPLIVVATVNFLHVRLRGASVGPVELYFLALVLNGLVAFVAIYGLAILFRRRPAVHARFMICTVFPLFTPVTDRLISRYVPALVPLVPRIDGTPVVPVAGFMVADVMLVALSIWDWRSNRRLIFPIVLALLLLYHASVMTFHRLPFWRVVGEWFVR